MATLRIRARGRLKISFGEVGFEVVEDKEVVKSLYPKPVRFSFLFSICLPNNPL